MFLVCLPSKQSLCIKTSHGYFKYFLLENSQGSRTKQFDTDFFMLSGYFSGSRYIVRL